MTWQTSHSMSLKFLRLVPVKSRLLKLAPLGCSKLRGKQLVVLGSSLVLSPMRRSQPPPKVGPQDLKQQMALFLRDLTSGYLALSVTEKRKVSRLKSVLKCVELRWNWSSQLSGVNPPMTLLSSVRQSVSVSSQASQISWNSCTLKLWLLARKMSLRLTSQSKKAVTASSPLTIVLELMCEYSTCLGVTLFSCSSRLLVLQSSSSSSSSPSWLVASCSRSAGQSRVFRCRPPRIIDFDSGAFFCRSLPVNFTRNSFRYFLGLEIGIIMFKLQSRVRNLKIGEEWRQRLVTRELAACLPTLRPNSHSNLAPFLNATQELYLVLKTKSCRREGRMRPLHRPLEKRSLNSPFSPCLRIDSRPFNDQPHSPPFN